jgi:UDPglucose--hexose-1-phosphate uridylyltransferase
MKLKRVKVGDFSELRQDPVSSDWVVIATGRAKRPHAFAERKRKLFKQPKKTCPFEDPRKTGHNVIMSLNLSNKKDWFVTTVSNKFPAFIPSNICPTAQGKSINKFMRGVGFHEVIITRDHDRSLAFFDKAEAFLLLEAYQRRFWALKDHPCVKYISIFHNHGQQAGASISHPHSQLIAIPVVPPDIGRSLEGSGKYWKKHKKCIHCQMIAWQRRNKEGIVYENKYAIAFCPFVSRSSFEVRIFPKFHEARFELVSPKHLEYVADVLRKSLSKLYKGLKDPSYNFFLHTAPSFDLKKWKHYHWHIEIIPKTKIFAGFEMGTGIDVCTIEPEKAASYLAKF